MIDKNVVAFVRQDTYTVDVIHGYNGDDIPVPAPRNEVFTYVCNLPDLSIGDCVVVHTKAGLGLATVVAIDDEVKIEPKSDSKYAWIVGKVDTDAITALQEENSAVELQLQQAYQNSMRNSYRNQILAGLDPDALALLPAAVRDMKPRPHAVAAPAAGRVDPDSGEIFNADPPDPMA